MPPASTISEALDTLPSSSPFPHPPSKSRPVLLVTTKKKFPSSTSAETHRPIGLTWVPSHPQHLLSRDATWQKRNSKVKETILIAGRDPGVKQSVKFKCRLPLPFLEQNGPHDEDMIDDDDDNALNIGNEEEEEGNEGLGFTASDLEMDESADMTMDLLENPPSSPSPPPLPKKQNTTTSPAAKRRRISKHDDEEMEEGYESLPKDFLELLKTEVPGGRADVSPGEFARVWKMSGRSMGNELVLAQNEYFHKPKILKSQKKGKGKGRIA
ncbi:hypothetical protein TWF481_001979 [Arthrobotrys musiformis]|uniref:Uncharacterized protein n=1 Tax=Arthrobotrys musiformis TaxID=47236 RepID=A0AAV9VUW8_9PEZI